jgi:cellulose synthase/poly-beta-1,6-N-acetylglucosamine synthase-like glycosyltransferase
LISKRSAASRGASSRLDRLLEMLRIALARRWKPRLQ